MMFIYNTKLNCVVNHLDMLYGNVADRIKVVTD